MLKVRDFRISDLLIHFRRKGSISKNYFDSLRNSIIQLDGDVKSFTRILELNNPDKSEGVPVPFSLKDIIDTEGVQTSYGSPIFNNHIPTKDAEILRRLRSNGLQLQGKTNTHEFAMGIVTPQSRNPWDIQKITGGSSGGSAAAVAACFSPFSLGTDTAGSIRIPSSFCGVTGLKPSFGLFTLDGIFPEAPSLDTVGPITRFASDLPLILKWMGAREAQDEIRLIPSKVAIIDELFQQSEKGIKDTVGRFLDRMESERMIEIHHVSLPEIEDAALEDDLIDSAENYSIHRNLFTANAHMYSELSRKQLNNASEIKAYQYIEAMRFRKRWARIISSLFKIYDVLISPTLPDTAPFYSEIVNRDPDYFLKFMKFTNPFNLSSSPSLTIPCGYLNDMPVGLQISGKRMGDFYISRLAAEFQKVTDYHLYAPETFGRVYNQLLEDLFEV